MLKSVWLLPCESPGTVQEQKNAVTGVYNTPCSAHVCPHPHSSPTDPQSKHFLLFVRGVLICTSQNVKLYLLILLVYCRKLFLQLSDVSDSL